jgi:hypothetical protein
MAVFGENGERLVAPCPRAMAVHFGVVDLEQAVETRLGNYRITSSFRLRVSLSWFSAVWTFLHSLLNYMLAFP